MLPLFETAVLVGEYLVALGKGIHHHSLQTKYNAANLSNRCVGWVESWKKSLCLDFLQCFYHQTMHMQVWVKHGHDVMKLEFYLE